MPEDRMWYFPAAGNGQWLSCVLGPSLMSQAARDGIVRYAPESGIFVEIGTWCGTTAAYIADQRPGLTILSIDPFVSDQHRILWLLNRRKNMRLFIGRSHEFFAMARCGWASCVFVDGHHTAEAVEADLQGAVRIIMPQSLILVHDFGHPKFPGVQQGVDEFCKQSKWTIKEVIWELAVLQPPEEQSCL